MEKKLAQTTSSCIKAVLFGPESTGKTTLAKRLAEYYHTNWVEEYMREYLQEKWDDHKEVCTSEDIIPIAEGQMEAENRLSKSANKVLFCDTNLLELKVYSEAYYDGYCDPQILKHALNNFYDVYFLTNIDAPWVKDDLRDKPEDREGMFDKFKSTLQLYDFPFVILEGSEDERFTKAVSVIDKLLNTKH